jgi:hypothetical protein
MYHVWTDNQVPYNVYGNRQDGYSYRGPSNSRQGSIPLGLWHAVGGCESGWAIPDPVDNHIVWSGCYDGGLQVYDLNTGHARDVRVWPEAGYGWAPADLKYRWHWSFPIFISPHNHKRVYVGSQFVHMTEDYGQSASQVGEVIKDPNTAGTLEAIENQVEFSLKLNAAMNELVVTINEIEEIRKELEELLVEQRSDREVAQKINELEEKILKVEGELFDIQLTGAREDAFRNPMKLYGRISALASDVGGFGADFKPTNQQVEVYNVFKKQLDDIQYQYQKLINEEIPVFNQFLISRDLELKLKK